MQGVVLPAAAIRFFVSTYEPELVIVVPHLLMGVAAQALTAGLIANAAAAIVIAIRGLGLAVID